MVVNKLVQAKPKKELVADKDGRMVASLVVKGYQIGDFLVVETHRDMHVGFYAGLCHAFRPRIVLASIWRHFNAPRLGEIFDDMHFVDCREVTNIKAVPVSRGESKGEEE